MFKCYLLALCCLFESHSYIVEVHNDLMYVSLFSACDKSVYLNKIHYIFSSKHTDKTHAHVSVPADLS